MSGINFNFNRGVDPLLGSTPDYSAHLAELEQAQKAIEQKRQAIMQIAQGADPAATPQSQTPIWDSIDELTSEMSPNEFAALNANEDYKKSLQALMEYVGPSSSRSSGPKWNILRRARNSSNSI